MFALIVTYMSPWGEVLSLHPTADEAVAAGVARYPALRPLRHLTVRRLVGWQADAEPGDRIQYQHLDSTWVPKVSR